MVLDHGMGGNKLEEPLLVNSGKFSASKSVILITEYNSFNKIRIHKLILILVNKQINEKNDFGN